MDYLQFYALFNSILVMSGRLAGDNERLCVMVSRFTVENITPRAGLEPGTARPMGQRLTY